MVAVRTRRRLARRITSAVLRLTRPITHRRPTRTSRGTADRNAAKCCARTLRSFRVTDIEKIWLPPHTQKPLRHPDGWLAGCLSLSGHSHVTKYVAKNIDPHDARHRSRRCRYPSDGASINFAVVPAGLQIRYRVLSSPSLSLSLLSHRRIAMTLSLSCGTIEPVIHTHHRRNNELFMNRHFTNPFTTNLYVDQS